MIIRALLVCTGLILPIVAEASAPTSSLRPVLRPGTQINAVVAAPNVTTETAAPTVEEKPRRVGIFRSIFPKVRPSATASPSQGTGVRNTISGSEVIASIRPEERPKVPKRFLRLMAKREKALAASAVRGSICGDPAILGTKINAIPGRIPGCGISNPVRVTSVDGVKLTVAATINCDAARALKKWVAQSVKPTVGKTGGGVSSLRVVAHYSCRTRNNQPGARISEHGKGNAIDIAAINLKNGTALTVLNGWRDRSQGKILKRVHAQACGTFGTVLGPNADRFHQDHFHFDVARHRGGSYCR